MRYDWNGMGVSFTHTHTHTQVTGGLTSSLIPSIRYILHRHTPTTMSVEGRPNSSNSLNLSLRLSLMRLDVSNTVLRDQVSSTTTFLASLHTDVAGIRP